jgi:hypothetical protein
VCINTNHRADITFKKKNIYRRKKNKFRRRAKPTEIQLVYIPSDSINICLTIELKVFVNHINYKNGAKAEFFIYSIFI